MKYFLEVEVEIKAGHGALDSSLPSPAEIAAYAYMGLRESTRGEYAINWMPRQVTAVRATGGKL